MKATTRKATAPAAGLALATLLTVAAHPLPVHAATVLVGDQLTVAKSDLPRPRGGMSMSAVEAQYGAPRERHATVGQPPITRWDYEHFAVFFEKDRVIDSVVLPASSPSDSQPSDKPSDSTQAPQPTPAPAAPGPQTQSIAAPAAPEPTVLQPIAAGPQDVQPQTPIQPDASNPPGTVSSEIPAPASNGPPPAQYPATPSATAPASGVSGTYAEPPAEPAGATGPAASADPATSAEPH